MAATLKIMGIHGLGDQRDLTWEGKWKQEISRVFPLQDRVELQYCFANYDHIFEETDINAWEAARALAKLAWSGVSTTLTGRRGLLDTVSDKVKWTAGYVVAWVEDKDFQKRTRAYLLERIRAEKPDVIAAHSLGSLISYNLFSHPESAEAEVARILRKATYITLGSQIGNPFVIRNLTPGRINALNVRQWYHLYNRNDSVFTAPIRLVGADNFRQIETYFDVPGLADHDADKYLGHDQTVAAVWGVLAQQALQSEAVSGVRGLKGAKKAAVTPAGRKAAAKPAAARPKPRRKALLVGINDYPNEGDRLCGCVNDVYLMSSVLQECGFAPEDIRVCLDSRATAKGILERLDWLLSSPVDGDELLFYYSGHGARIPEYGPEDEPDRHCETLVPYDFDWTPESSVTDERIHSLYSQLPETVTFGMILDCCHSGGMHRDGGNRIRALNPPDDVRHRSLRWDMPSQMWVPREFRRMNPGFSKVASVNASFFGADGATTRLGRATMLRGQDEAQYKAQKKMSKQNFGPYLPLIIEACQERQYSFEYRHGVESYGAFTYSLASVLRRQKDLTFSQLVEKVRDQLAELKYDQKPQILGPTGVVNAKVPWMRSA